MMKGTVLSEELRVVKNQRNVPFCSFTIFSDNQSYSCFITGKQAYSFLFEIEKGTEITFSAKVTEQNQLVLFRYFILQQPSYFGKIYNYKGQPLPLMKEK